jgi:response regulator RpfG family c-di-GMP phosphodiesterase
VEVPLVIADQNMTDMKGDRLLIKIQKFYPQVLKVMLTEPTEDIGNVANWQYLYRFISKPWSKTDLVITVTEALRSYQQSQKLAEQELTLQKTNQELQVINTKLEKLVQDQAEQLNNFRIEDRRNLAEISPAGIFWNNPQGQCI